MLVNKQSVILCYKLIIKHANNKVELTGQKPCVQFIGIDRYKMTTV